MLVNTRTRIDVQHIIFDVLDDEDMNAGASIASYGFRSNGYLEERQGDWHEVQGSEMWST